MEAYLKYYDILEITPDATLKEIRKSYFYLKELYSGEAIEIAALYEDFSTELRSDYLVRLDEAYENLVELAENNRITPKQQNVTINDELRLWIDGIDCFTGEQLRCIRERMGVDYKAMFTVTRIQPQFLENIEKEYFEAFQAEIYLRSYLIEYTRFLLLDTNKVLADYMPRYRSWSANRAGKSVGAVSDLLSKMA
jgi:hypothetical protein